MKLRYIEKSHAYYLDGKRCRSVTGIAGLPDDKYSLEAWKRRQVAVGLAMKPHLLESVAAHHDDKSKLNDLIEEAMTAAGATSEAEWGTAAHRVTERIDAGQAIIQTVHSEAIASKWSALLSGAKLKVATDLMERLIVYPDKRLCGRFDRIVRDGDGLYACADLKTGDSAASYPHSIATQMALYVNAPLMAKLPTKGAGGWMDGNLETTEFEELPKDLRKDVGYLIHMPRNGEAGVYRVDLKLGWKCVTEIIFPALRWRSVTVTGLLKKVA